VAHEQGRREGGDPGAWAVISAHVGQPEGIVAFLI
jgi:hypothetical protein